LAREETWGEENEQQYEEPNEWPSIFSEVSDMAMLSNVSYPISFLIRQAKAGKLKNSSKVLARFQLVRDKDLSSGPLSPGELLEIVEANRDCIEQEYCSREDLESRYGWLEGLNHWVHVEETRGFPGSLALLEFDDHYDAHRLAYGLVINRIQKRIVVVFRGTYAERTDDWKRNLQSDQVEVPVPSNLLQRAIQRGLKERDSLPSKVKIHRGMYEYLFDNAEKGPRFEKERYEEITDLLFECLRENPDFDICVTGHSLGGALAEVFAVFLTANLNAFEEDLPIIPDVTCIPVGSMITGDAHFGRTLSYLERNDGLRYLRVTNEDDPVVYFPPLEEYALSGMQLRLNREHGHALWDPRTGRNYAPFTLNSARNKSSRWKHLDRDTVGALYLRPKDDRTESTDSGDEVPGWNHPHQEAIGVMYTRTRVDDMEEFANSWPNLIRALKYSFHGKTDYIRDHSIPSYLGRMERESEYLSRITLNSWHHEVGGALDTLKGYRHPSQDRVRPPREPQRLTLPQKLVLS
jgi:hypothetical protein